MADDNPPPFSSQLDTFTLYHLIQEEAGKSPNAGVGPALPALGHALAGSVATATAKALLYPLDLCVTRLQVQKQLRGKGEAESAAKDADTEYSSIIDAIQKIYKTEGGLKAFYSGCLPDVGKGVIDSFLFFLFYNGVRQFEQKRARTANLSVPKELAIGVAAGSIAKFFTTPIQNIVTRQQTAALVSARDPSSTASDKLTVKDIALQIRDERGIAGFWAGYSESIVLTINPSITFAVDNLLMRLLPESKRANPSLQVRFLVAALSKAIATTLTYPAMLAKSRAQVSSSTPEEAAEEEGVGGTPEMLEKSSTLNATPERQNVKEKLKKGFTLLSAQYAMIIALRKIYREEGLSGLYSGLEGEVVKGFLQHGLTMMVKDKVHIGVIQLYYLLLKATRRWPESIHNVKDDIKEAATNAGDSVKKVADKIAGSN